MSKTVLTARGLSILAAKLRARHEEDDSQTGQDRLELETGLIIDELDEARRRLIAQKLLTPIGGGDEGYEEFTIEDWLEVCRQSWQIRMAHKDGSDCPIEHFRDKARQLRHSTSYVAAKWGLDGAPTCDDWEEESFAQPDDQLEEDGDLLEDWEDIDLLQDTDPEIIIDYDDDLDPAISTTTDACGNRRKMY
ncbi:hypothetical protein AB9K35_16655 [Leisingera sp. XS_AS12]|uniref:hypothetical protein n=1 Tax=Leisingera sp. XS_AS12 TaxID=3241294 RepID=UPI003514E1B2